MSRLPKYLQPDSIKKTANKKELTVYKHLVSGALSFKGDFSTENSLFDLKATEKKSVRVSTDMLQKLLEDTITMSKQNAFIILDFKEYYVMCKVKRKREL